MLLYAGYMECTVHLLAGMPFCYIYRQQEESPVRGFPSRQPNRKRQKGMNMAINRVTIMGNLTRDAELRKKGDATSVLTFGLAINEKKKDSETGEYVDAPVFVDCALFGARAEALAPYLTKGKKVSVDGRLRYHSWMKNEEKRHALSVLVTDIEFADSKGAGKDTVSAQGQPAEPETYDADIPF